MIKRKIITYVLVAISMITSPCEIIGKEKCELPLIGGQVIIEPGQTPQQIESWFRIMKENGMTVCRIRLFEEYIHDKNGSWDYSLFDYAFRAAEKYNIKIFATLFPLSSDFTNTLGGFKFPASQTHLNQIADYIRHVVEHFKQFDSLYGWVLINEPGCEGWLPDGTLTKEKFSEWKAQQVEPEYTTAYSKLVSFDTENFLLDYNTWYLRWIADNIAKYDTGREIHVNNHQIFQNIAEYDFPAWSQFLTSLGASAHPSWHFSYFERDQYALALSANCEIVRSGAKNIPFWITELQGGNNTYSGNKAFCPTKEEIIQWLWTGIGTGVEGIIFWSLNSRAVGEEAGEWALLDFQNNITDRVIGVREVTGCLAENNAFFSKANAINSPISVLYTRESLWVEKKIQNNPNDMDYEGRLKGGVIKSALAYYKTLLETGIKANFKEINEYDWTRNSYKGEFIILANQIAIPSKHWAHIREFVKKGGKLIVEGLTSFYDENMTSLHSTGFPLKDVFGGELSQVICIPGDFTMGIAGKDFPVHLWKGFVSPGTARKAIKDEHANPIATYNTYGDGEVIWIPSLLGLGAERSQNQLPLSELLIKELEMPKARLPFSFSKHHPGVIMHTMQHNGEYVTILINKSSKNEKIKICLNEKKLAPAIIYSDKGGDVVKNEVDILQDATMVIKWSKH